MYEYKAQLIRVVDADTLDLLVDKGFNSFQKIRFRLSRIDAWEVRGEEKVEGKLAAQFVEETLADLGENSIVIRTDKDKTGSFGRYLAEVIIVGPDGEHLFNLNDRLVKEGHAEYREY